MQIDRIKFDKLVLAALACPGVAQGVPSVIADAPSVRLGYSHYRDSQDSGERVEVQSPDIHLDIPLSETVQIGGGFLFDSVSGASPYYLDTLSGASGLGVKDNRRSFDLYLTKTFENNALTIQGVTSNEDDYDSHGVGVSISHEFANSDVIKFGLSGSSDIISSSEDDSLHEQRKSFSLLLGYGGIASERSIYSTAVSYNNGDGYWSDPYKYLDVRPRSKDSVAWYSKYRFRPRSLPITLQAGYRFYLDSWDITSHTFELSVIKDFGERFYIQPGLRYYTQSKAFFASDSFPPQEFNRFYSPDQRLLALGDITPNLVVGVKINERILVDLGISYLIQRSDLQLGGTSDNSLERFSAWWLTSGISIKF